jgi:hypothetical protein
MTHQARTAQPCGNVLNTHNQIWKETQNHSHMKLLKCRSSERTKRIEFWHRTSCSMAHFRNSGRSAPAASFSFRRSRSISAPWSGPTGLQTPCALMISPPLDHPLFRRAFVAINGNKRVRPAAVWRLVSSTRYSAVLKLWRVRPAPPSRAAEASAFLSNLHADR